MSCLIIVQLLLVKVSGSVSFVFVFVFVLLKFQGPLCFVKMKTVLLTFWIFTIFHDHYSIVSLL